VRQALGTSTASSRRQASPRPFLKWVGGKRRLLDQIRPLLPQRINRYFEPFIGGGALFFDQRPSSARLWDVNNELINCYVAVRDHLDELIVALRAHRYEKEYYYALRATDPKSLSPVQAAARTICLNRTGFNGLYRVNRSGNFNVPFGRYTNPTICDAPNLRLCSTVLQGADIQARDFRELAQWATPGDFVYFDPPYVPRSATAAFTDYTPGGFSWDDHLQLADLFGQLHNRGVRVMLSNADVPLVRDLYSDFDIETVYAARAINSRPDRRGNISEVVVRNYKS